MKKNVDSMLRHVKNHIRAAKYNLGNHGGEVTRKTLETAARNPATMIGQGVVSPASYAAGVYGAIHGNPEMMSLAAMPISTVMTGAEVGAKRIIPKYAELTNKTANRVKNSARLNKALGTEAGKDINFNTRDRLRDLVQKGYCTVKRFSKDGN